MRQSLKLENWPLLFFCWRLTADVRGAFNSYYRQKGAFKGFGPSPWFYLRPNELLNRWKVAESRENSMFHSLTFSRHPYRGGYFCGRDTMSQSIKDQSKLAFEQHFDRVKEQRQRLQKCGVLPQPKPKPKLTFYDSDREQ